MLRVVLQVLPSVPELYPDSPEPVPGPSSALAFFCAPCIHIAYLSIFLIVWLGLVALCWLMLGVVQLSWFAQNLAHCMAQLPNAPMPSCSYRTMFLVHFSRSF